MAFLSRRSLGGDFWLEWKIRLLCFAAALSLVGIYFDDRRVIGVAIMVLAVGIALRFGSGTDLHVEEEDQDGHASIE